MFAGRRRGACRSLIQNWRSFVGFVLAGLGNLVFTFALYTVLIRVMWSYLIAYSACYIAGIVFSYLVNSHFVFKRGVSWKSALQFPIAYIVQYLVGVSLLYVFVDLLGIQRVVAPLLVMTVNIPIGYFLVRRVLHGRRVAVTFAADHNNA